MTLDRPDRRALAKGENYQDLVSGYLCSRALAALNRRHVRQLRAGHLRVLDSRDVRGLTRWLIALADYEFSGEYLNASSDAKSTPKRYLLDREKLMDSMADRAGWVIRNWDGSKVEGRRRGGQHSSATTGTLKGPPPRFSTGDILPYYDLPNGERKATVMAQTGMSASTYYALLRKVPGVLERIESRKRDAPVWDHLL